jgi:leucyl-tRNA synthetase
MGKLRAKVTVPIAATEDVVLAEAAAAVPDWLADKTILKQIYVPGRLVNFVVR